MRISAGLLKGRKVATGRISPKREGEEGFRPTSSKVREAVFDILKNCIAGAAFLDLYAGSGAVGFEALSRGAARCCFVEHEPRLFGEIISSVRKIGLDEKAVVFREEAFHFLQRAARTGVTFGIIFADPPYASEEIGQIFPLIDEGSVLQEKGILLIEHSSKKAIARGGRTLELSKTYKYGDTMLTLFRKES